MGGIIHEALEDYYNGLNDSPKVAVHGKIIDTFEKKGVRRPTIIHAIAAAKNEGELLEKFRNGTYKKPDGELYSAPRMTKVWKEQAAALGLDKAQRELAKVEVEGVKLPDGGLIEVVSRILDLTSRYEDRLMVRREWLEEVHPEIGFDFVAGGVRFLGFMDLVAKVKPEHREKFQGKTWILVDYKTGKAKDLAEHSAASDQSLQLSLYHHAITQELKLCQPEELYMALHYLDATFAAATSRTERDFDRLIRYGTHYQLNSSSPGLVKRLFFDGQDCSNCELRAACIKHFGMPTDISSTTEPAEDDLDWSF